VKAGERVSVIAFRGGRSRARRFQKGGTKKMNQRGREQEKCAIALVGPEGSCARGVEIGKKGEGARASRISEEFFRRIG